MDKCFQFFRSRSPSALSDLYFFCAGFEAEGTNQAYNRGDPICKVDRCFYQSSFICRIKRLLDLKVVIISRKPSYLTHVSCFIVLHYMQWGNLIRNKNVICQNCRSCCSRQKPCCSGKRIAGGHQKAVEQRRLLVFALRSCFRHCKASGPDLLKAENKVRQSEMMNNHAVRGLVVFKISTTVAT